MSLFSDIGRELLAQDNRATSHPIFMVQVVKRICGMDRDYAESFEWVDSEGNHSEQNKRGSKKVYYRDIWTNVQPFFTERAARDYMNRNRHNLRQDGEPRIYVESGHRNEEWIALRAAFIASAGGAA